MAAETLNFGPEWLRALASGAGVTSPPPSPAMPKYKLADYRYGREEMLALYVKDDKVPEEMEDKEFAIILQDEPLPPLALVPLTEEEQRNFSMSVNSVAVLRLMGKGAGLPPGGVARGRGSARGRGRGRGESGFYQRSIEDGEAPFGRGAREIHRSQSWDDRGERRFEKPVRRADGVRVVFDEASAAARKEFARSDSDNWRILREEQQQQQQQQPQQQDDDEENGWRLTVPRGDERWRSTSPDAPRSAGWREHGSSRKKFDFEFRDKEDERGQRRNRANSDSFEDEKDGLPEWCMDDEDDEMGTFDSSGAFMPLKKNPRDAIPEEHELDFQGLEDEEERLDGKEDCREISEGSFKEGGKCKDAKEPVTSEEEVSTETISSSPQSGVPSDFAWVPGLNFAAATTSECQNDIPGLSEPDADTTGVLSEKGLKMATEELGNFSQPDQLSPGALSNRSSSPSSTTTAAATEFSVGDPEDDDGMKHLQQEAEKLVASLQDSSLEEERFTQTMQEPRNTAAALPLSHEAAMKWFYKDPQGEIQGPFTTQEMAEWFQAGYFAMTLHVKRGCDEGFQPLGEVIKMWGRVPFAPGPSPPPLLGNMDQERLKKQQELAAAALYQQLQHQQYLQLMNSGEPGVIPSMNRSMSVPDSGSMWDLHTSASQQAGSEASLWDLPINSSTQGPILEHLQLQHKLQERRDAELRAKRVAEEERKRREEKRQQEEQKRREEEELFRRKQCRQQQELLLKLLQHSQQQSSPPLWNSHSKSISMKAVLELQQQENERLLQKQQRAQQRVHGGLSMSSSAMASMSAQWGDTSPLWGGHEKNSPLGPWEESLKNAGSSMRSIGLKNSRSSPSLSDSYGIPSRQNRKKTEEEEKLLKLLQGIHKPQDGFTQWCEQMLHALNTSNNLDAATFVSFLKEVESPYDVHDYIRSYLGDTLEAKEFAKQFLERRAKQKANQQRQQQESSWLSPSSLQSMFQANHNPKQPSFDSSQASKMKKRPVMLHADPSILGYSLHSSTGGEMETVEDY
ncbi:GRB10-interacting GYF protein 1 isoform X2 [Ambystoma mexicanum]|uniref:GRB10-interacting GYF protein 1 isoform X2 n=1 Tax=Ambystoma mexicanum TaxID=8296 RepID=UPI0037E76630